MRLTIMGTSIHAPIQWSSYGIWRMARAGVGDWVSGTPRQLVSGSPDRSDRERANRVRGFVDADIDGLVDRAAHFSRQADDEAPAVLGHAAQSLVPVDALDDLEANVGREAKLVLEPPEHLNGPLPAVACARHHSPQIA